MTHPLLSITDLNVWFDRAHVVKDVNLHLNPSEKLAIIGESGSGKSVTALTIMRLLSGSTVKGSIRLDGEDVLAFNDRAIRQMRGRRVAMVFQDPMTSLNPTFSIGQQLRDVLSAHTDLDKQARSDRALELLVQVGIRDAERCLTLFPHELSGGMRQRVMIALAIACNPQLLIADEPTTALDVTVQEQITHLLVGLCDKLGIGLLFISHNLDLVGEFVDRIAVMYQGRIVETGTAQEVMGQPSDPYTQRLLASIPRIGASKEVAETKTPIVIEAARVIKRYPVARSGFARLLDKRMSTVLQGIDMSVRTGEIVGVVGESGSGKSSLARILIGLDNPNEGKVLLEGQELILRNRADRMALSRKVQMVFQGSHTSLNPRKTIRRTLNEAMRALDPAKRRRPEELLEQVRLDPALLGRYPHQLSGGQRQRIGIARALSTRPEILIADEPTSALDVSVQKEIIELLQSLQRDLGMTMIIISHDLGLIGSICDRVLVMRAGEIVEQGAALSILNHPNVEYTQSLLASIPRGLAGRGRYTRADEEEQGTFFSGETR